MNTDTEEQLQCHVLCYCCCCCCCCGCSWFILLPSPQANPPGRSSGGGAAPVSIGTPSNNWRLNEINSNNYNNIISAAWSITVIIVGGWLTWNVVFLVSWIRQAYLERRLLRNSRHGRLQYLNTESYKIIALQITSDNQGYLLNS